MKTFVSFAVCCSAIFACALEPPATAPPDAGGETQQAIEPAAQQDETQDEATESLACPPEDDADSYDDATASSIAPRAEGEDDDNHWYTTILPIGPILHELFGGHKHGGPGDKPERKICHPGMGEEVCLQCCYYNHDHVDGWDCRRIRLTATGLAFLRS